MSAAPRARRRRRGRVAAGIPGGGGDCSGLSLLELLVAVTCTLLLATAAFSLIVGSARAARRQWSGAASLAVARGAVASVGEDLGSAGRGLEDADEVQQNGMVIRRASSDPTMALRAVLPAGPVAEIWAQVGASTYRVPVAGAPAMGASVAAVDQPLRPAGAPLPVGTVVGKVRLGGLVELSVAWRAAEAVLVSNWGPPRALAPVTVRVYDVRSSGGRLRLRRRDLGGSWQPIADGLDGFDVHWILDTDADGVADSRRGRWLGAAGSRACAVQIEARVRSAAGRTATGPLASRGPQTVQRWIPLGECR